MPIDTDVLLSSLTIPLTDRPPVIIEQEQWPVLAQACEFAHDGKVRSQANHESLWTCKVRKHADGRVLVAASYTHDSQRENSRSYSAHRGVLLASDVTSVAICESIRQVCWEITQAEHADTDVKRWTTVRDNCIADMPAERLI